MIWRAASFSAVQIQNRFAEARDKCANINPSKKFTQTFYTSISGNQVTDLSEVPNNPYIKKQKFLKKISNFLEKTKCYAIHK